MGPLSKQTFVQHLWEIFAGGPPSYPPRDIPLITSICYYSTAMLAGRLMRGAVRRSPAPKLLTPFLLDFITTFQMMACSLENAHVRIHYGMAGYVMAMVVTGLWGCLTLGNTTANPCTHVARYIRKQQTGIKSLVSVAVQLCGGLLSYKYARMFWALEISEVHASRYHTLHCTADLTVSPLLGFTVEFGATLICSLLAMTTFSSFIIFEESLKLLFGSMLTVLGLKLTGMYLNPVNATNQTFGCQGASVLEHVLIYWAGPICATLLAIIIHNNLPQLTKSLRTLHHPDAEICNVCGKVHGGIQFNANGKAVIVNEKGTTLSGPTSTSTNESSKDIQHLNVTHTKPNRKKSITSDENDAIAAPLKRRRSRPKVNT